MHYDPEQETVEVLEEAGATNVEATGRNKFRIGNFPSGKNVMLAYYRGYGGWQFEFASPMARDRAIARFQSEGISATEAPADSTQRRMAIGPDRRLALRVARLLGGSAQVSDNVTSRPTVEVIRPPTPPVTRPEAPPAPIATSGPTVEVIRRPTMPVTRLEAPPAPAPSGKQDISVLWEQDWSKKDVEALKQFYTTEQLSMFASKGFRPDGLRRFLGVT